MKRVVDGSNKLCKQCVHFRPDIAAKEEVDQIVLGRCTMFKKNCMKADGIHTFMMAAIARPTECLGRFWAPMPEKSK